MYGFAPFPPPAKHAKLWKLYLAGSIAIDLGLCLGLLLYGGFALVTVLGDAYEYNSARQSKDWIAVTGKISSSGTIPEGRRLGVVANYTYAVGGQIYSGNRLLFSARRPAVESEAEADKLLGSVGRFTEENEFSQIFDGILPKRDRSVTVHYDPKAPEESTLKQEYFANPDLGGLWPAVPISIFLIAIVTWSIRSWVRYLRNKEYELAARSRLPA